MRKVSEDLLSSTAKLAHWRRLGLASVVQFSKSSRGLRPLGVSARNQVYSRLWSNAAEAARADYRDLGSGFGLITRGGASTRVFQQITPMDDPVTLRIALDHVRASSLFRREGLTVAESVVFQVGEEQRARELIARTGPCVVKPARGTAGGDGVTVGVTEDDVLRAARFAARFGEPLLAEQLVLGDLYRLLIMDGELVDVIRDRPPHVVGDGESTIGELMHAENLRRQDAFGQLGLEYWYVDLDTMLTLRREGRRLKDVPPRASAVQVKSTTNDRRVEDSITYKGPIHPDVIEEARAASSVVGLRLAGVDILSTDLAQPLQRSGGALIEVNGSPGIHRHYQVQAPEGAQDVGRNILERLLS